MHILIIGEYYRPLNQWFHDNGAPTGTPAIYNLYQYLGNHKEHSFHSVIFNFDQDHTKSFENGSTISLIKFSFPIYLIWKFLCYFKLYFYLKKHLKTNHYDIIYGLSTYSSLAAILGKKYSIPSVGRIYGTILTQPLKQKRWFKIYTRHLMEILAIKRPCDLMIATQDGTAFDKVAQYFNPQINVKMLFNGMDRSMREKLLNHTPVTMLKSPLKICSISRLEPYKRHHLSIKLLESLVDDYGIDAHLIIIGTGSLENKIKELIKESKCANYIKLLKEVPHQKIIEKLEEFDLSIFLYEGGSLGNVMWENALSGRLICTVDNGETTLVFQDQYNAIVSPDDDQLISSLSQKINAILNSEKKLDLALTGRKKVAKRITTWEDRFEKEMALIRDIRLKSTL